MPGGDASETPSLARKKEKEKIHDDWVMVLRQCNVNIEHVHRLAAVAPDHIHVEKTSIKYTHL